MSKKTKKIVAVIALVFMALFCISLVLTFYDRRLFNGAIGACALFTGGIGIALFLAIKLSRSPEDAQSEADEQSDNEKQDVAEEAQSDGKDEV